MTVPYFYIHVPREYVHDYCYLKLWFLHYYGKPQPLLVGTKRSISNKSASGQIAYLIFSREEFNVPKAKLALALTAIELGISRELPSPIRV